MKRLLTSALFLLIAVMPAADYAAEPAKSPSWGLPVLGGETCDEAVPLEFNRDYKLNHHQRLGDFDCFSIDLEPGMHVTLELLTFEKGLAWSEDGWTETEDPYAGLTLQDADGHFVRTLQIDGAHNTSEVVSYRPAKAASYYLIVGTDQGAMHKDDVVFKVSMAPYDPGNDLLYGVDAGPLAWAASIIEAKSYPVSYLGGDDDVDLYGFFGSRGEVYIVDVSQAEDAPEVSLYVKIVNATKDKIFAEAFDEFGHVSIESFKVPRDENYYIEVRIVDTQEIIPYYLRLTKHET